MVGCVKSNMGSGEAASGVCGLTKVSTTFKDTRTVELFGVSFSWNFFKSLHTSHFNFYFKFRNDPSDATRTGGFLLATINDWILQICLAFHHGKIAGNLHYNDPIEIPEVKDNKIQVLVDNVQFKREFAAMNSFSYGGANVHVLLKGHHKEKVSTNIIRNLNS